MPLPTSSARVQRTVRDGSARLPSVRSVPRPHPRRRDSSRTLRTVAFVGLAVAIVGAGFWLAQPKERAFIELGPNASLSGTAHPMAGASMAPSGAPAELTMRVDMSGFVPKELSVPAGRPVRLMLVNPDDSMHSDGGGVHGFTVPKLGIDLQVPPLTNMVITLPAAEAGDYAFWCDTCCGGKENPAMQGVLRVRA